MNKVYKVIWNRLKGLWVVASELGKGKQKSSSQGKGRRSQTKTTKRLSNAIMLACLFTAQSVFAAGDCEVGTAKELGAALNNDDCTNITLTADINLASYTDGALFPGASNVPGGTGLSNNTTKFDFGTRTAITIDGGTDQHSISNGNNQAYRFAVRGGDASNQVTFTIKNADLTTTAAANNANHFFASVGDSASNVNIVFDNIKNIPNSTLALMTYGSGASDGVAYLRANGSYATTTSGNTLNGIDSNYQSGYTYNQNIYSKVTIGTFLDNNASNPFNSVTYKQWVNGSKVDFAGKLDFYGTGDNGSYAYVFWNNTNDLLQNQLTFKTGSDVSFNLDSRTKLTSGDGNGQGYSYVFEDGSSFKLWSKQNVLGSVTGNNVGLQIGSYDKDTGEFGAGAKIIYAGVDGAQLAGDGITNLGGKNYRISSSLYTHSIINNGQYNSGDVIFNLAEGSLFNVSGVGINVLKSQYLNDDLDRATTNVNNSGIYIRSATDIDAATGMNIVHDGSGQVVIKNTGTLTTTTSGITLSSASGNSMNVDMSQGSADTTSGVINATSGTGITVGSSATDNVVLNLTGGEINTSGDASAVTFSNATNTATHNLNALTVNLDGSGNLLTKADAVDVALSNVVLNINNRVGLNNLAGIRFLSSDNGTNTINVNGTGTGIATTNTAISNLDSEALQINVNGAGVGVATTGGGVDLTNPSLNIKVNSSDGTALTIADGSANTTTIGSQVVLDATGATAIKFSGNAAKTFVNEGTVKGAVDFAGDVANTITNNGILDGTLTTGNGNNALVLGGASQSLDTITFGNGNNSITINNGALVKSITTGSGDDTFTLNDLSGNNTYLGTLDAGTGTNTLDINRSQSVLQTDTSLQGFTNINLNESSDLTLASQDNITGGTVLLDSSSKLQFGNGYNGNFSANLGHVTDGDGSIIVNNGADVTLANAGNNTFAGDWTINSGGALTATRENQLASSSGIALAGVLNLNGLTTLNNALTGAGMLNIDNNNQAFNFGDNTGNAYAGKVNLTNVLFDLSGNNATALTGSTLNVGEGSTVSVGTGTTAVGNLTLASGTTVFTSGSVTTGNLDVTDNSVIQIAPGEVIPGNLLDQDESNTRKIITSTNTLTADKLALLTLQNDQGAALENGTQVSIDQGDGTAATGTYNYDLSGLGGGLSVTAQLVKLALAAGKTLTLDTAGASSKNLNALITGTGNLALNASGDTLTLNNAANDYTGTTTINDGTVVAGSNNALGNTSLLTTLAGAAFNLNGKTQTLGTLANSGTVDITGGKLTLNNGGTSDAAGGLTGNGNLVVSGGELAISKANAGLAGSTAVGAGGTITLNDSGTLGSAAINIAQDGTLNLNADQTMANVLSGAGSINTGGNITLSGENTFSGTHTVGAGGALTITQAGNLGSGAATVNLNSADAQLVLNGLNGAVNNVLSGVADSTVGVTGGSDASLGGNNSSFLGTYSVGGDSTLTVGNVNNLGADAGVLLNGAGNTLNLAGYSGTFGNQVAGTGSLSLNDNADVTLGSTASLAAGIGVDIAEDSALTLTGITDFNQLLTGSGALVVNGNDQSFDFGGTTGGGFTGNIMLNDVTFDIANNRDVLGGATLTLNAGSISDVGVGTSTLGNLNLNGGELSFRADGPQTSAEGTITTDNLALNSGTVVVTGGNSWENYGADDLKVLSILSQDYGNVLMTLVDSGSVTGELKDITLKLNNTLIETNDQRVSATITQDGEAAATAYYNFGLSESSVDNDAGLFVKYSLVGLDLISDGDKGLLIKVEDNRDDLQELRSRLSGSGGLVIEAGDYGLTISNSDNSYSGSTIVKDGQLTLGDNNVLGNTSQLEVYQGASTLLNGYSQKVGTLANSGTVDITGGTLTLNNGGTSDAAGGLTGNGNLVVSGGELAISKANAGLAGSTAVGAGGTITLNDTGTLGSAAINIAQDGTLNLNADQTMANVLSGAGSINTGGNITLSGENTFGGTHIVGAGGALTITQAGNLGSGAATVNLNSADAQLVLNGLNGAVNNVLSGVADSTVGVTGGSDASLGGNNSSFLGTYSVGGDSTLTVGSVNNLGADAGVLLNGAGNALNLAGYSGTFGNQVAGTGSLSLSDSADVTMDSTANLSSGIGVDIADNSALTLASLDAFDQTLTGSGALNINDSTGFTFGSDTGSAFAGQVNLRNAQFMLSGDNTLALTDARLNVGDGTTVSVDVDPQAIGGLTLSGGTTQFTSTGYIESGSLDVTDNSIIQVESDLSLGDNLLEKSSGESRVLVKSDELSAEDLAKLTLQDLDGNSLANNTGEDVVQNGATVAEGFYNFALSGDGGLSVMARLVKLALLADQTLVLNTANTSEAAKTFTAQITGNGNLELDANTGSLTLSNTENDYTGSTLINSGTVIAGSHDALGNTSQLSTLANSVFDLNGQAQTLGVLVNAGTIKVGANGTLTVNSDDVTGTTGEFNNTGVVDIGGGTLTLNNGGTSTAAGGLTGNGSLIVSGGELALSGANVALAGTTTIDQAGIITLSEGGTLGNADVAVDGMLNLNVNQTLANVLSGIGEINTNGNVVLNGENTFQGTHLINANGKLTISQAANLGSNQADVALQDTTSSLVLNALNGEVGQSLSGVSGSQINVANGSSAILTGLNDGFKGTYNVSDDSTLTVGGISELGEEASVSLGDTGDTLNLSAYRGDFANQVDGKGAIALTGDSSVTMNSMVNVGADIAMSIDENSQLQLSDVTTFNQALSGGGALNVNAGNQAFNFGVNTGGAFTGNVTLTDTTFNLDQNNENALANATLTLSSGSVTHAGSTDRTLKNVDVNGGELAFEADAPQSKGNGIINTDTLALNGGDVSVTGNAAWENVGTPAEPGVSILEQDQGEVLMTLVSAGAVTGNANSLNLSINGIPVISGDQAVLSAITQGDKTVANATHSYGLTSRNGDDSGLYIKYGLTALQLMTQGTDALLLETGAAGSNQTLNAVLSGEGGLNINASNGALTLANGNNSYTGGTTVSQGALLLGANNALGQTSELNIQQGASTSLNGFKQTVGMLDNSGTVSLDNGELVLSNGGQSGSDDGLKGEGTLTVAGGNLSISGTNDNLSGDTVINSGSSITLSDNGNLGTSNVGVDGALNLNAEGLTLGNALSGDGQVNVNAATTLSGNSTFTGDHYVSENASLTITQASNLGADQARIHLDESGASLVMSGLSGAVKNALAGVQDSIVALTNSSHVQLTGNNDSFTGRYALNGNSALTVDSLSQLGTDASVSLAGALDTLILSGYQGDLSNNVTGDGVLTLADAANVTFGVGYQVDQAVGVNINSDSSLTMSGLNNIDHALAGNGTLNVTSGGPAFTFGGTVGTAFAGKVDVSDTALVLGGSNTLALTNADLTLSENSLVNVSDGVQNIGGLTLNGGTLKFENVVDNNGVFNSEGIIEAGSIDVTGGGEVQVNLPTNVTPGLEGKSLLTLDEGAVVFDLAHGDAKGSGQELTLTDTNGQPISQSVQAALTNEGATGPSAVGAFDYGLTTGTLQDGLYVNYGLKAIELQANAADALRFEALEANNGLQSNSMSAKISGSGDLAVEGVTDGAILSLDNGNNDYTGATLVRKGGLRLDASDALGLTSELAMSGGTQVDINGTRQTIGQLNAQADSLFNLNGGDVTIKQGGQMDGLITGAGQLSLSAGMLNVSQANSTFSGNTAIGSTAEAVLAEVTGLGSGDIANQGTLTLDGAQGILANSLSESGNVQLQNQATIQLTGNNTQYTGAFTLEGDTTLAASEAEQLGTARINNNGKLILDVASDWSLTNLLSGSGDLIKQGSGTLKLIENSITAGNTLIENGLIQLGAGTVKGQDLQTLYVADSTARAITTPLPVVLNSNVTIQENGALGGFGSVTGNVDNAGRLIMSHALTGDNYADFTINGNYVGQKGSRIIFDTVLAGDNSATDRLVINGDASGVSTISVNNIGGQGSYTSNGIKIVDISGTSGANFELEGRVVAGAYEYKLYQGGVTNSSDGDWYLRTDNPDRPEAGSYIANLAAANTMFNTSLENRSGETWYTDALTGEKKTTSMWLRTTGSHNRSRDASGAFKTQDNRFVMQIGGDVFRFSNNENDLWRVGLMTGYANSSNNTISSGSGSRSKGSAQGYSVGTYGTWFADEKAHTGAYVDSWLQYSWFKNEVNGEELAQEKYDSKGFTASLESGYTFLAGNSSSYNFYLQPKVQAIWMGVKADDHMEASQTRVSGEGDGNLQTRLGMKTFMTQPSQEKDLNAQVFKPYIEATWIHNSKDFAVNMSHETTGSHTFKQGGTANVAEVKLGLEGDVTHRLNIWGNVGQQVGTKGYSDTTVTFGVKYNF